MLEDVILAPHALKRLIEPEEIADGRALPARPGRRRVHRRAADHGRRLDRALSAWSSGASSTSPPSPGTGASPARRRSCGSRSRRSRSRCAGWRPSWASRCCAARRAATELTPAGRGAAAARGGDPRRGRARARGPRPPRRGHARARARGGDHDGHAAAARRRSPRSTARIPGCRSRCATRRPPRSRRSWRAAPPTSASPLRTASRPAGVDAIAAARAAAPRDPAARRPAADGITLEDLRGRPFILAEPGTALRETRDGARARPRASARSRCSRSPTRRRCASSPTPGLGVSIVPGVVARAARAGGRRRRAGRAGAAPSRRAARPGRPRDAALRPAAARRAG